MRKKQKYFNIKKLREDYNLGLNITEILKHELGVNYNTNEIIEVAYELQSGSYIENYHQNKSKTDLYIEEVNNIIGKYLDADDFLLDIGSGELTTISLLLNELKIKPKLTYAFDISWSRIYNGIPFAKSCLGNNKDKLVPFVADIFEIPFPDKSIDVTTSSHALEPNGNMLEELLMELFRVTKKKLVLFEPYYEANTLEGKNRMDALGYIKGLEKIVENLGGSISEIIKINNSNNQLNPTYCFVISPPKNKIKINKLVYSVPGKNMKLEKKDNFYSSIEAGVSFPIIYGIPILKSNVKILTSALSN